MATSASLHRARPARMIPAVCVAVSTLFGVVTRSPAQVDLEINRQIWKQKFGVLDAQMNEQAPYGGWLSQDADGDGVNNRSEFVAGTNPFRKTPTDAHFRPPVVDGSPASLSLTFPTVPGKLYGAESNMSLVEAWSKGSLPSVVGDGTPKTLTVPKTAGNFFHLTVTDQATQGDQVSDWAKHMLGLSPNAPIQSQTSYDHGSLASSLAGENVVSLFPVDASAYQPAAATAPGSDAGVIRVSRTGGILIGALTVPLVKSGTAVEGVDYTSLPAALTFPSGVNSIEVKIVPLYNPARTSGSTVFLAAGAPDAASADGNYTLGSPSAAGVTIYPASNPTGTGLTANYYASSSSTYASLLNFGGKSAAYSYTKSGSTVTATITYSGIPAIPLTANNPVALRFTTGNLNISPLNTAQTYNISSGNGTTSFVVTFSSSITQISGSGSCEIGNFLAPLTRIDPVVDFAWGSGSPDPSIPADNFSTRWTGQILPQYTQTYYFLVNADDGLKLWINGQPQTLRRSASDSPSVTYNYTQNSATSGTAVLTYSSSPLNVGDIIPLNFTTGNLNIAPFNTSNPYTVTAVTSTTFTVALTGADLPVSDLTNASKCTIDTNNLVIDWVYTSKDRYCSLPLQAGVYYDIKMEHYEGSGGAQSRLWWYSEDQAKQIIPTNRLFPASSGSPGAAAPAITSPTEAVTLLGSGTPFSLNVTSSNGGTVTASGLPSWLSFVNGVLSGTPTAAGIYQFTLTTTNSSGTGSAVMTLEVLGTPSQLTRETWTSGVTGTSLASVPWTNPPSATATVSNAESSDSDGGANTGERLRGYFIAPATGNYYFWIAASNSAELWISNDAEPVNKVRRASVTSASIVPSKTWNAQANQKSQWLSLIAGKKYYIEAIHNTGASGAGNHLSLAWYLDPTGNTANPITTNCPPAAATTGGIIPGHVLSPWDNPPTTTIPGTLYVTNLQGADGLSGITGTGGAFLRVNGNSAVLQLNYTGLTSGALSKKIFRKIDKTTSEVIFDMDAQDKNYPALKTSDAGYTWSMQPSDLTDLNAGNVYLGISTLNHPTGELTGTFGKIAGSQTPPPVPSYPSWSDQHATSDADNSRFLTQATFGPSPSDMLAVKTSGYRPWIESQFTTPATKNVPYILENLSADPQNPYGSTLMFSSWWKNSVTAPDQLRQRAAFALSEILVVSDTGPLNNNGRVLADYYDSLLDSCFGNFRDILKQVTLSPAMGVYLDMRANYAGSIITGLHPNENYAREILQLFSAGLYRTWPDGTLVLDSSGNAIPTYDQDEITGFARVFTGWNWGQPLSGGRLSNASPSANYLDPMSLIPTKHELGTKQLLDNVILPAATVTSSSNTLTDSASPYWVYDPLVPPPALPYTRITNLYDINGLRDLENSIDNILANSAVGPYICRQLIQRLVTSHPKPEYVQRVVRAFNGEQNVDGLATGIRGDMKDVFRAILLDYEARSTTAAADPKFGKQREPLLRLTGPARAFPVASFPNSTYSQNGLQAITVTTPSAHRLVTGEQVRLSNFSASTATQVPTTQAYSISNVTPNSFTVNNNATISAAYTVSGNIATINASGVAVGDQLYLSFTSGGLSGGASGFSKAYAVDTVVPPVPPAVSPSYFTVVLASSPGDTNGSCLIPKLTSGYNVTGSAGSQVITIQTTGNHNLVVGDSVYLKFAVFNSPVPATNAIYPVAEITGPNAFRVLPQPSGTTITNGSQGGSSVTVYPLKVSQWIRDGSVTVELSNWNISYTQSNLNQTPLNSTTVFNFFYPDYQYPGLIAQAGMTTPEFQLTNDSNTMTLTNLITQGTLTNNTGNANGYMSLFGTNAITIDLAPYMTPARTSNAGIPTLVNDLGVLLTGGILTSAVKTIIADYVTANQTYTTPTPTATQMRERVRAIVHLIVTSAEYAIQR